MESRAATPETYGMQMPPSPESEEPTPKQTKAKAKAPRAKATKESSEARTGPDAMAWFIACFASNIDWNKAALIGGYKNAASARSNFSRARGKFLESIGVDLTSTEDDAGTGALPKKRKTGKADNGEGNGNGGKKKRVSKKAAKAEDSEAGDSD